MRLVLVLLRELLLLLLLRSGVHACTLQQLHGVGLWLTCLAVLSIT